MRDSGHDERAQCKEADGTRLASDNTALPRNRSEERLTIQDYAHMRRVSNIISCQRSGKIANSGDEAVPSPAKQTVEERSRP